MGDSNVKNVKNTFCLRKSNYSPLIQALNQARMSAETKYGKILPTGNLPQPPLGMFFETKYGKITGGKRPSQWELGMFFETKYGKIPEGNA